jgi:hypothetical protein
MMITCNKTGSYMLAEFAKQILDKLSNAKPYSSEDFGSLLGELWIIAQNMKHAAIDLSVNEEVQRELLEELIEFHNSNSSLKYILP